MEFQLFQIYTKTCIKAQDVHQHYQCVLRREQQIRQVLSENQDEQHEFNIQDDHVVNRAVQAKVES